jgi:succinyl-diaminopimelate desuccinylase
MAHLDVVDPGKREEWTSDPWTVRVEGDLLYGRGVEDNQQAIVGALLLARALHETGVVPPLDLGLLFVADEETGSQHGIAHLLANRKVFGKDDLILVPDGGVEDGTMIEVAEKGLLWVELTVKGKQCHGSTPDKGVNAHRAAAHLAVDLAQLYEQFPEVNPLFDPPTCTFEPTRRMKNVDSVNIIPGEDVFAMDCRILPTYTLDDVLAAIDHICREVEARCTRGPDLQCTITRTVLQRADAAPATDPGSVVVQHLARAIRDVYGVEGKPMGIGGGTVAAHIRREGFPAVVWCKLDETLHQPNESCRLANLVGDAQVFAHVLFQG